MRSSGVSVGLVAASSSGQADAPDQSDEERALRGLQWSIELSRLSAAADRRRRLRDMQAEAADAELRSRLAAERQEHATRLDLARDRRARDTREPRPPVDLAGVDVSAFRVRQL